MLCPLGDVTCDLEVDSVDVSSTRVDVPAPPGAGDDTTDSIVHAPAKDSGPALELTAGSGLLGEQDESKVENGPKLSSESGSDATLKSPAGETTAVQSTSAVFSTVGHQDRSVFSDDEEEEEASATLGTEDSAADEEDDEVC